MSKNKNQPYLNRKKTQTLLTTLKVATTAGALSLTLAGWGILADLDARHVAQAAANPVVALADQPATAVSEAVTATPKQPAKLKIVQWVRNAAGDRVAVVQDKRGALWYVMGSAPRQEAGAPGPPMASSNGRASA